MKVQVSPKTGIEIDDDIVEFIKKEGKDFRICTSCFGAELLPVTMKAPKLSDIRVKIGNNILYISKVQAHYISKIDKSMLRGSELSDLEKCFL
ncbi:MAG: hypothetical protein JSV09_06480 [Thermoplasmata archaeon]|nr:MAG: hypothetical protein JSV09_06480 [Thermoplasmata archaeon]